MHMEIDETISEIFSISHDSEWAFVVIFIPANINGNTSGQLDFQHVARPINEIGVGIQLPPDLDVGRKISEINGFHPSPPPL